MERNVNIMKNTVYATNEKATRAELSIEELREFHKRRLTPEEADFSEEHLSLVWWFLNENSLPEADWFDVVIFRYLLTVKRWFTCPELHRYSFTTLAVSAMRSAVHTERRKQSGTPQILSLDAPYKGTYGAPLGEYLAA